MGCKSQRSLPLARQPSHSLSMPPPPTLIGRQFELAELRARVDRSLERGCAVALVGDPGVGKSALQTTVVQRARERGLLVMAARGTPAEQHLPFAGLHQLLWPVLDRAEELPARQREALLSAFGVVETGQPDPFLISLAALELVGSLASTAPVLMCIDDAHWMDRPTLDAITFMARRLDSEPITILMSLRPEAAASLDPSIEQLHVQTLSEDAADALLAREHPDLGPILRERVLRTALGNPLALMELPIASNRSSAQFGATPSVLPMTEKLELAFAERARQFPRPTLIALTVAAVDDGTTLSEVLAAAGHMCGFAVGLEVLQPAFDARLVSLDGQYLAFRHSLVRSAVHQMSTLADRNAAHAALAAILAGQPDRAVWHEAAALTDASEDVAERLAQAAARARQRGAVATAVEWLERAAELTPDAASQGARLLSAAEVAFELGRLTLVDRFRSRIDVARLSPHDRARLVWLDGIFHDGRPVPAAAIKSMVAMAVDAAKTDRRLASLLLLGAARRTWWGDPGGDMRHKIAAQVDALELAPNDPIGMFALATTLPVERGRFILENLRSWDPSGDAPPDTKGLLGNLAFCSGDFVKALEFATAPIDQLRAQGRLSLLAQALCLRALAAFYLGNFSVARSASDEALRLAEETAQPVWVAIADVATGMLNGVRSGEAGRVTMPFASDLVTYGGEIPMKSLLAGIQLARGIAEVGQEEFDTAYATLRPMFDENEACSHHIQRWFGLDYFAEAATHSNNVDDARKVLADLAPAAAATPAPGVQIPLAYARAVLADDERAEGLFLAAVAGPASGFAWHRGRLELAYGSWLRRQRRVTEARAPLRSSRDTFDALGATSWAARADRELRATGERGWRPTQGSWDHLSPQEAQIAELAAQGLSNRDIAQQLYLSHRTVGSHLYRIFPKLGITSRAQLGRALQAPSLEAAIPTV